MLAAEWINTYGIHHWRTFRSSYRNSAWVGFEPTATKFCSDALTDWATMLLFILQFHLYIYYISICTWFMYVVCFFANLKKTIYWQTVLQKWPKRTVQNINKNIGANTEKYGRIGFLRSKRQMFWRHWNLNFWVLVNNIYCDNDDKMF